MNKVLGIGLMLSLVIAFGSCKPKQSAYKAAYEAAKEREVEENSNNSNSAVVQSKKPTYPTYNYEVESEVENETVRTEKITAVYDSDASGLRNYSVVIASLSVKPNAEALKARMEQDGYNPILAQNEQGMYRVIISSFDDKASAVNSKNSIKQKYLAKGSTDYLKKTYGIPFEDIWVLQRQY